MLKNIFRYLAAIILLAAATGCLPPPSHLPRDYSNPVKRVAILPMKNDTNDVDGPEVMRKKMAQALERRSYVVKDLKETDQILRDRMGITLGGQLSLTTAQKLGEELGVEGVLYGTLMDFDESTLGAINVKKVRGKFKLVNTMTGQTMWATGPRCEKRTDHAEQVRCSRSAGLTGRGCTGQGGALGDHREHDNGKRQDRGVFCRRSRHEAVYQGHRDPSGP